LSINQPYNEKELLLRIAEGDEQAFAVLFKQYFHHIYLLMLKYTNRHSDAEDIVQQAFVNVWEKRHLLAGIEKPDKWLFTIAINEFRIRFRKSRVSDQYRQYLTEVFEEEQGSPEDLLISKQQQAILKKALEGLSSKQQQAYLLSREEGLTYAEIAGKMGLEPTTVKEHISRALKSIRTFIIDHSQEFLLLMLLLRNFF
jgi:RNA polymerase sigma-70 factor (family 1)